MFMTFFFAIIVVIVIHDIFAARKYRLAVHLFWEQNTAPETDDGKTYVRWLREKKYPRKKDFLWLSRMLDNV